MCGAVGAEVSLVHLWINKRIGIYAGWRREKKNGGWRGEMKLVHLLIYTRAGSSRLYWRVHS